MSRPSLQLLTVRSVLDDVTGNLELSLVATQTALGLVLGLLAIILGACWRITTPTYAAPPTSVDYGGDPFTKRNTTVTAR